MQSDEAVIDRWQRCAVSGEVPRNDPPNVCAGHASSDRGCADANGHTVLDVATGPGEPALGIAAVVRPKGGSFALLLFPRWPPLRRDSPDRVGGSGVEQRLRIAWRISAAAHRGGECGALYRTPKNS